MTCTLDNPDPMCYGSRMKLTFMRGIPGCGKSTVARRLAENGYVRVNRDELRLMVGPYDNFTKEREALVSQMAEDAVLRALRAGRDVVVDETNLDPGTHNKKGSPLGLAVRIWEEGLDVEYALCDMTDVEYKECDRRNRLRKVSGGGYPYVPDYVMERFRDQLAARQRKGFWTVADLTEGLDPIAPVTHFPGLPDAWIFDIDGTLAHMVDRGPYDTHKYHTDRVDFSLAALTDVVDGYDNHVIVMSGRSDEHRETTKQWLAESHIWYDELYMRPGQKKDKQGNLVRDSIVKYDLFNEHIRGKYNVMGVFDDRDQVVRMWRTLGVKCFQVGYGDF